MLDKWLADLAEDGMEKTASDQFGEALEQLSAQELEAIYELQGEKIKEAGWAGRAMGGLGGAMGGALGGAGLGAGAGGAMGALYAPPDRHMEGFWQGARRGAELGAGAGALGGGLGWAALGGGGTLRGSALGTLGGTLGGSALGSAAGSVGGGFSGAGVDPAQPTVVVERKTKSRSKKKSKEKKSYDLAAMQMEKDAFLKKFVKKLRKRVGSAARKAGDKLDPSGRRRRVAAAGGVGLLGGATGYVAGRKHEQSLSSKPKKNVKVKVGSLANRQQAELLKEAAKRGLMRRMVEGIGGVGLGKQRKEVSELQQHARAAGKTYREAQKGPMRGSPGMRRALVDAAGKHNVARKEYQSRAFGRGVKTIGGVGGAGALGGLAYGGYRLGQREKEKKAGFGALLGSASAGRGRLSSKKSRLRSGRLRALLRK